jgi:dihydrodipicolinate synthase/N-acetylneuraminate lyase
LLSRGLEEHINLKGRYGVITAPFKNGKIDEKELQKRILESYKPSMQGLVINDSNGKFITYVSLEDINALTGKNCDSPKFQGGYGIVLTPFTKDGKVDFKELEKNLNYVCESGIKGVVACGSTSEFTYHSREEAKEVMAQERAGIKVKGEQAGTKLLFPMMGLLFLVFAILLVPAFLTF